MVLAAARRQFVPEVAASSVATVSAAAAATANQAPVISKVVLGTPNASTGAVIGTVTATDPNGDKLTYKATTTNKGTVTITTAGVFTYTPTATARHDAAKSGGSTSVKTDKVTVTVTDSNGAATSKAVTVTISPVNAVPVPTTTVGTSNSSTGVVTGSVTATDANSDPLTYKVTKTAAKGTVVVTATGGFTYTPSATARHSAAATTATVANKADTFTVTVDDGYGGSVAVPVSVTIAPANVAPTATATVGKPDFSNKGAVKVTLTGSDADKDPLTYTASTPTSGAVVRNSDGSFTYTPSTTARSSARSSTTGMTDTFTITVSDGYGGTATVTVSPSIAPRDSAPIQQGAPSILENSSTGIVTGNLYLKDPEGDPLTYTAITSPKGNVTIDPTTGTFTYTPTAAARHAAARNGATTSVKTDSFTLKATDIYGMSLAVPVTVNISPFNTTPTGTATVGTPDQSTGIVTGTVVGTDGDRDTLKYSVTTNSGTGAVQLNAATGVFTYTPNSAARHNAAKLTTSDASKTGSFTVTITDGYGGTVSVPVTVSIAPSNVAPTAGASSPSAYAVTGVVTGKISASDANNDTLSYSVSSPTTAKGTVSVAADGSFTYTPTDQARDSAAASTATSVDKTDSFVVTVSDGYGGSLDVPVSIVVLPKASFVPTTTVSSTITDPTIGLITGRIIATDPDGGAMTFSGGTTTTTKGRLTLNADGAFTYVPTLTARHAAAKLGAATSVTTDTMPLVVTNSQGVSATTSLTVSVSPKNTDPTLIKLFQNSPSPSGFSNNVVIGYIKVSDADGDPLKYRVDAWSEAYGPTQFNSVPTQSGDGKVYVWDTGGGTYAFNYIPTSSAQKKAYNAGRQGEDVFSVTFTDGYRGTLNVQVRVPIGMYSDNY
jgi:VCBS repeat-containing protein